MQLGKVIQMFFGYRWVHPVGRRAHYQGLMARAEWREYRAQHKAAHRAYRRQRRMQAWAALTPRERQLVVLGCVALVLYVLIASVA